jgi:hypothetical protein
MPVKRSALAGLTNYSGASLEDVIDQLRQWRGMIDETFAVLGECRSALDTSERGALQGLDDVSRFVGFSLAWFTSFAANLDRLVAELPVAVLPAHDELIGQMLAERAAQERYCIDFRNRRERLPREDAEIAEKAYVEARSALVDLLDLDNVRVRLRTFVGVVSPSHGASDSLKALELKPNVFGVGLNVNYIIGWLRRWRRHYCTRARKGATGSTQPVTVRRILAASACNHQPGRTHRVDQLRGPAAQPVPVFGCGFRQPAVAGRRSLEWGSGSQGRQVWGAFLRSRGRRADCAVPVLYLILRFLVDLAASGGSGPA